MGRPSSRKEWLKKRDAMNAQLKAENEEERRSAEDNLEPLPPGINQLPLNFAMPEEGRSRREMPWHQRD